MAALSCRAALTKGFLRELKKIPKDARSRILRAVDEILTNPFSGVKLQGELEGRWRWRVGKYRIVYVAR
jgi:mRNA-degrading endonuclease RelE of RelBE toxin-antitoxin system